MKANKFTRLFSIFFNYLNLNTGKFIICNIGAEKPILGSNDKFMNYLTNRRQFFMRLSSY